MKPWALLVAAILVAAGSCGGDNGASPGTTTPTTEAPVTTGGGSTPNSTESPATTEPPGTTESTPPNTGRKQRVGTVNEVIPKPGTVSGQRARDGMELAAQDLIATEDGKIKFDLGDVVPFCQVETASQVVVLPGGQALIEVKAGSALCTTGKSGQKKRFGVGAAVVTAVDPVFVLGVGDGGNVNVQVAQGYVRVDSNGGAVVVGPNQQGFAGQGQPSVGPWSPDDIQDGQTRDVASQQIDEAIRRAKPPGYPKLQPDASPTLRRARKAGTLFIAVDGNGPTTFTEALARQLGRLWDVKTSVDPLDPNSGTTPDVVLTASPPKGSGAVPFVVIEGQTWFAVVTDANDKAMPQALRRFLAAALQSQCPSDGGKAARAGQSCYERAYDDESPGTLVPLNQLAGILGLG